MMKEHSLCAAQRLVALIRGAKAEVHILETHR
jgi:hypothetical protein